MISLIFGLLLSFHPIHLSITEIDHNEKSKALQVTMRIFVDDLPLYVTNPGFGFFPDACAAA